jgi:hypothetical protein
MARLTVGLAGGAGTRRYVERLRRGTGRHARIDDTTPVVYALLDEHERPLYIGGTTSLERRTIEHRSSQVWWPEVRYVTWQETRVDDLFAIERMVTTWICPPHNRNNTVSVEARDAIWQRVLEDHLYWLGRGTAYRLSDTYAHWTRCILDGELRRRDLPIMAVDSGRPSTWRRPARVAA